MCEGCPCGKGTECQCGEEECFKVMGQIAVHTRHLNKTSAFTTEERDKLHLRGMMPDSVEDFEKQKARCYENFKLQPTPLLKYIYLMSLEDVNQNLFYSLMLDHMEEMMPIAYTPTVGEACQKYSHIFMKPRGMFISIKEKGHVFEVLQNWPCDDVRAIVVTDSSRILGLGDQGCGGIGIPIGKLCLFTACGGVHPETTLPIALDVGTNREDLLKDPLYLGLREKRVDGKEYYDFIDEFAAAVLKRWPRTLLQWEDFSNDHAFHILEKYYGKILTFNDDIQGTAAVTLAAALSAVYDKGTKMRDERFVFLGAGEAAVGICDLICQYMALEEGLPIEEGRKHCFLIDSKGLLTAKRPDLATLAHFKMPYCHDIPDYGDLLGCVKGLKPTALIGVSTMPNTFTEAVIREMRVLNTKPMIFPLSNPTSKSECTFKAAVEFTDGSVYFASGSPFDPYEYKGVKYEPSQANNVYIFPGLSQGAICSGARAITDPMFLAAATVLAKLVPNEEKRRTGKLFPGQNGIRAVEHVIATAVAEIAWDSGLATALPRPGDMAAYVKGCMYVPKYHKF